MAPADAQQEPFRLSKIGIIMLGVTNVERSVAFYRDMLGLKVRMQFEGFVFFETSGVTLALSQGLAQATGRGPGATEVVFSVDHVRAAHLALKSLGVDFMQEPRIVSPGNWAANFSDPDGHILSIFGPE